MRVDAYANVNATRKCGSETTTPSGGGVTLRAWAGAVVLVLLGCFIGHWVTVTVRPPLGCGSGELRVLTKDVDLNRDAEVSTRVHGVLRRGTLFEVRWTKGRMSYIAVHSALPADLIARVSTRAELSRRKTPLAAAN